MGLLKKARRDAGAAQGPPRPVQLREIFLLDELGRFVCGATAAGLAMEERHFRAPVLEAARALVAARDVPPGTFVARSDGDLHIVLYGGQEFFGCAAEDAGERREVPHELAAVVNAFERAHAPEIAAGALRRGAIEGFPVLAASALKAPEAAAQPPTPSLAFARAAARISGTRLAVDLEIVNSTPWRAERVTVRVQHDPSSLVLVSVKARGGGYHRGVLELPAIEARSSDRAVLLFEPRTAGTHLIVGELALGLEGGRRQSAHMRRVRVTVARAVLAPAIPASLVEVKQLVESHLRHWARLELSDEVGAFTTVESLTTEIEKEHFAKILDYTGPEGPREAWFLAAGATPDRPVLVQVSRLESEAPEVVVAARTTSDILAASTVLRARLSIGGAALPGARQAERVAAEESLEFRESDLHPALVAQQISYQVGTAAPGASPQRAQARAISGVAPVLAHHTPRGPSAGEELVPGLLEQFELAFAARRRSRIP